MPLWELLGNQIFQNSYLHQHWYSSLKEFRDFRPWISKNWWLHCAYSAIVAHSQLVPLLTIRMFQKIYWGHRIFFSVIRSVNFITLYQCITISISGREFKYWLAVWKILLKSPECVHFYKKTNCNCCSDTFVSQRDYPWKINAKMLFHIFILYYTCIPYNGK